MKRSFLNDIITENSEREVDSSFGNFLRGFNKMKSLNESIDAESMNTELVLFIENDSHLTDQINSIKKTLFKHWKKGEYDSPLAERAWGRLVNEGAQMYADEIGKEPRLWEEYFSDSARAAIVEDLEHKFYNDLKKGKVNMEELFNE